ncbi:hypothetical protein QQ045_030600 [Rhodiola kirilowii]
MPAAASVLLMLILAAITPRTSVSSRCTFPASSRDSQKKNQKNWGGALAWHNGVLSRFLLSPGVLSLWPKLEQKGLDKGPSDHAAVALMEEEKIWGAKPFRVLNVWLEFPKAKEIIREAWEALEKPGWKGYTFQRKLSRVRVKLALWNRRGYGDINYKLRESRKNGRV